jgi:hypothetical protein
MQIQSLDPNPAIPGAFLARFEDGTQMPVTQQQAQSFGLASRGATAQNAPPTYQDIADKYAPQMPAAQAQDLPLEQPGAQPSALAQLAQPGGPRPYVPTAQDQVLQQLATPYKMVPGRPAFDPQKEAAKRSPVPMAQTVQQTGGQDFDPNAIRDYQKLEIDAAQKHAEADALRHQSELVTQQGLAREVIDLASQQQVRQKAAEDNYRVRMDSLTADAQKVASQEVNPNRVFDNMNAFSKLLFVVASGIGGMATHGQRNIIGEQMSKRIDQDIHAQEVTLAQKRQGADNALGRLSQEWGSLEAGRAALRVQQFEAVKQRVQAQALELASPAARANSEAILQDITARQAKELEQLRVASQGQISVGTQSAMMAPRAASAGGLAMKTPQEMLHGVQAAQGIRKNEAEIGEKSLSNLEKRGELTGAVPGKASKVVTEYGEKRAEIMDTINMARQFMARNDVRKDKDGNWVPTKGIAGVGFGTSVYPESMDSNAGQTNLQQIRQIGAMGAKAIYGILTATEKASFAEDFLPVGNEHRLVKGVGSIIDKAEAKLKDLDAAYGPNAVNEFESRRATMGAEKAATRKGISEPE